MSAVFYESTVQLEEATAKLSIRAIDVAEDAAKLWRWWNAPHVAGKWSVDFRLSRFAGQRRPYDVSDLVAYIRDLQAGSAVVPAILAIDDADLAYVEAYRIGESPLATAPQLAADDRGFHFMIGEPDYVGRRVALVIGPHVIRWQLTSYPEAKRLAIEPRYDNEAAIKSFLKVPGTRREADIELPHKRAALLILERDAFFASPSPA